MMAKKLQKETEATAAGNKSSAGLVFAVSGVAIGLGAVAWLMKRKHDHKVAWDPERILDACDNAAARLDEILFAEARQVG